MCNKRIPLIDAVRGLCLVLMVAFHFGFTLYLFGIVPEDVMYSPLLNVLEPFFAGIFILLCGVSSNFSRSNIKRGLLTAICAAGVSAAMFVTKTYIAFGILHFLALCMLIYGVFGKYLKKVNFWVYFFLAMPFFVAFPIDFTSDWTAFLGIGKFHFGTADYFPLLKWIFIFLIGTKLGDPIKNRKFPAWFYEFDVPVLPWLGRHTLIIYLLHQPIFYGIVYLLIGE